MSVIAFVNKNLGNFEQTHVASQEPALISSLLKTERECASISEERLDALIQKVSDWNLSETYIIPERRNPPIEDIFTPGKNSGKPLLAEKEIIAIHPMQIQPSPFSINLSRLQTPFSSHEARCLYFDGVAKGLEGVGRTVDGKSVILQQAHQSCGMTCLAMLAQDCNKEPDWPSCEESMLTDTNFVARMFEIGGLKTIVSPGYCTADVLHSKISENGPGMIAIYNLTIGGHWVILDRISMDGKTATIRDPYEGRQMTIRLERLMSWGPNDLIQVEGYPKELY